MRQYNHNISVKANAALDRRETQVRRQRGFLLILILILISLGILLGSGISALASAEKDPASYNKYYKSIRIEYGDTLWKIADEYVQDLNIDKQEYIEEICFLNSISADDIKAGEYIVISYYAR